jgi:acetate kinase
MEMGYLGINLDEAKNESGGKGIFEINTSDSPVKILVIPTNEELEIARQCFGLLEG